MAPPPAIAPRPVAPPWTVVVPFVLLASAMLSAIASWQDGDTTFVALSGLALALDIAVVVTTIVGRRTARRLGAVPHDAALGAIVVALLMIVGFALLMLIVSLKPVVK